MRSDRHEDVVYCSNALSIGRNCCLGIHRLCKLTCIKTGCPHPFCFPFRRTRPLHPFHPTAKANTHAQRASEPAYAKICVCIQR